MKNNNTNLSEKDIIELRDILGASYLIRQKTLFFISISVSVILSVYGIIFSDMNVFSFLTIFLLVCAMFLMKYRYCMLIQKIFSTPSVGVECPPSLMLGRSCAPHASMPAPPVRTPSAHSHI